MVTKTPAPAATTASVGAPLTPLIGPLPAPMAGSEAAEVTRLRQRLDEVQQRSRGEVALLNRQITTLIEQLDVERAKNAKNAAGQVAAPAPGTTTPPSERIQGMLRRAVAAEKQGQTQSATFQYQQVLELEPAQPLALVRLGNLALDQGQPKEAEKYLLRAFYVNPDDKDVLLPLGSIYVRAEKADLAIAMLARAVALYPDQAPMHRFLGVACSSLGWVEAGELQLKRAFALDPKDPEAAFDLAVLYATKEPPRLPLARQWYATAKELGAASDPGLEKLFGTAAP